MLINYLHSLSNTKKLIVSIVLSVLISVSLIFFILNFFNQLFSVKNDESKIKNSTVSLCLERVYLYTEKNNECIENPFSYIEGRPPLKSELEDLFVNIESINKLDDIICSCALRNGKRFNDKIYIENIIFRKKSEEIEAWICFDPLNTKDCSTLS